MTMSRLEKLEIMEKHMRVSWDQIDEFFNERVCSSEVNTRKAFGTQWAEGKWDLFQLFGEKLCLTSSVENTLSDSDIVTAYKNSVIKNIPESFSIRAKLVSSFFLSEFSQEELRENKIKEDTFFSGTKISKGMKVTRALRQFISDKKELSEIQTLFSRFIQSLEAKGTLDVSIDFFDILCMSLNDKKDWRSCHNFIDGEFGGGAFSYALDGGSAIAQIYTEYSSSGVADKIWRQMVWFSDDNTSAVLSRQYPSSNPNNRKAAQDLIIKELGTDKSIYGFVNSERLSRYFNNIGGYHYNDISADAVPKAMVVVLDRDFEIEDEEKGHKDVIRNCIGEGFNPRYTVGVDYFYSPYTGNELYQESWEEGDWFYD